MERPLTALFIDCDSFFASIEQHLDPSLLGLPVGVAPVMAETSCCIAASYEAKRFCVKTGTGIREARILCPGIRIVESKPAEYIKVHHRIIEVVENHIHVEAVLSIDEMWAWLPLNWRDPDFVRDLGRRIKDAVNREIGPAVKVSVGAAPNKYLAKMASKMGKPDGLFLIRGHELPEILHSLALRDLTGIARNMEARLHASGVHTVAELCAAPKRLLRGVWGGVMGERLWHLLQGGDPLPGGLTSCGSSASEIVSASGPAKPAGGENPPNTTPVAYLKDLEGRRDFRSPSILLEGLGSHSEKKAVYVGDSAEAMLHQQLHHPNASPLSKVTV